MESTTSKEITWTSAAPGATPQKLSEIDDQHLSNILWFNEIFNGWTKYNSNINFLMEVELFKRGIERLPWKPLPVLQEIRELKAMGMIHGGGSIIVITNPDTDANKTIGSITHIEGWEKL